MLIEKWSQYIDICSDVHDIASSYEKRQDLKAREIEYKIFSLQRLGYTFCVTFVESYLFYLYYNLKSQDLFIEDEEMKALYELNNKNINDTHIIEEIIIPKFVSNDQQLKLKSFTMNIKINNIRNSIIHTTAFENLSNQSSYLELFFEVYLDKVQLAYELVINFALYIDSILPEEHKILFWWQKFEDPDFKSRQKIKIVNPNSNLSKLDFYQ